MGTKEIKALPNGEQYIEFTEEEMQAVGWFPGDTIQWKPNRDGSYTLTRVKSKEDTEFVLVDCVSVYRMRYCVEVPKGKKDWALDRVVMQEAKEFSQEHLDELITSHRIVSREEAIEIARSDNDYVSSWTDDQIENAFITLEQPEDDL